MTKGMTTNQITQIIKSEVRTRVLLTIAIDAGTFIRVLENELVTSLPVGSTTYIAGSLKRGDIESSDDGSISKVSVTISNINLSISALIASQGDILTNKDAKLEEVVFINDAYLWKASYAYALNEVVMPLIWNGYYYQCTQAGTTPTSEPTWPLVFGSAVTNGGARFTCINPLIDNPILLFEGKINNVILTYGEFTFDIERNIGGYSTVSPNATYDVNCQVKKFKDARCGYTGGATYCDKTLTQCITYNNYQNFYGFPTIVQNQVIKS